MIAMFALTTHAPRLKLKNPLAYPFMVLARRRGRKKRMKDRESASARTPCFTIKAKNE